MGGREFRIREKPYLRLALRQVYYGMLGLSEKKLEEHESRA